MKPDAITALFKTWDVFAFSELRPDDTVLATDDWVNYVLAMTETVPAEDDLIFPTEEEVRWAWPQGVTIVFEHPVTINHLITSVDDGKGGYLNVEPSYEQQLCSGMIIGAKHAVPVKIYGGNINPVNPTLGKYVSGDQSEADDAPDISWPVGQPIDRGNSFPMGQPVHDISGPGWTGSEAEVIGPQSIKTHPVVCVGVDASDLITGYLMFGYTIQRTMKHINFFTRFVLAMATAMGHRLTDLSTPTGLSRPELRRQRRELPSLRVLKLSTPSSKATNQGAHVEWSKRWIVRGHWRLQPYGEGRSLRKLRWIDPHIKGPSDKPLDVRPTVWETNLS